MKIGILGSGTIGGASKQFGSVTAPMLCCAGHSAAPRSHGFTDRYGMMGES
jgi:hypothetical protein